MTTDTEMPRAAADAALRAYCKAKGVAPVRGRFYVTREDGWQVDDAVYGSCIGFDTKADCLDFAAAMREYVRNHGDVSLYSVPNGYDSPFTSAAAFQNRHEGADPLHMGDHWNLDRVCAVVDCPCRLIIPVLATIKALERATP